MTTMTIPASELRVGDLIHNNNHGRHLLTVVLARADRVVTQFDGIPGCGHTFRDVTAEVTVDRQEG